MAGGWDASVLHAKCLPPPSPSVMSMQVLPDLFVVNLDSLIAALPVYRNITRAESPVTNARRPWYITGLVHSSLPELDQME